MIQPLNSDISLLAKMKIPSISKDTKPDELRKQTDAFESIILKMLLDNALKDEKNLFSSQKDPGEKIYKSMYREEISKASAGSFGISEILYDYLSRSTQKT